MKAAKYGPLYRKPVFLATVVVIVALICVFTPTYFAGWAPAVHWTCSPVGEVSTQIAWAPLSLANSPYGGFVFVNATVPPGLFGPATPGMLVGGGETNGTVWGAFWLVIAKVSTLENETVWGPGVNLRCTSPFAVSLITASQGQVYTGEIFNWPGGPLFGPNSTSDSSEPTSYNLSSSANGSSLYFSNGFHAANAQNVSTCDGVVRSFPVRSSRFTVRVPFSSGARNYTVPFTMPSLQTFHHVFPANFGTWQVDNLSAPGGPGGGWAFNYVGPCA
jgi:hypothetical protein